MSAGITQAQSVSMVRNLCRATIGELLWLRTVLDADEFESASFGGVTTHLPKKGTMVAKWLEEGAFEALEKGEHPSSGSCQFSSSQLPRQPANRCLLLDIHLTTPQGTCAR